MPFTGAFNVNQDQIWPPTEATRLVNAYSPPLLVRDAVETLFWRRYCSCRLTCQIVCFDVGIDITAVYVCPILLYFKGKYNTFFYIFYKNG